MAIPHGPHFDSTLSAAFVAATICLAEGRASSNQAVSRPQRRVAWLGAARLSLSNVSFFAILFSVLLSDLAVSPWFGDRISKLIRVV